MINITLGQYYPGNSPVHRLDPRTKLVLTIALVVAVFLARGFAGYAVLLAFIWCTAKIAGIRFRILLKGLKPLLFIIVLTFLLNVFFPVGGNTVFAWKFIRVTDQGLRTAAFMALRLSLLVLGTQLMTLTTSPIALTNGLESLLKPLSRIGFPTHELAMMMAIALRFIPSLIEEANKITMAQKARGAEFESGNLIGRARAMLPLLVPLFVSAFRRADELALAMESRCYHGGEGRTRMKQLRYGRIDAVAALVTALVIVAVCLLPF